LSITPSAYFTPNDSAMYFRACGSTRSGHQDLGKKTQENFPQERILRAKASSFHC
jgi:hypothetical protein